MRALPYLFLPALVIPFALAAPVPMSTVAPVESYSDDALAKLPFMDADDRPKEFRGRGDGPKAGQVALAVSLPRTTFALGEPVEPLFVLRNRTDRSLGFSSLLDFTGDRPHTWNAAGIEVRDAKTGKVVGPARVRSLMKVAGDGPSLPAKGYYTASGDIAFGPDGKALAPGDYELSWRYGWAKSNTVKFTVVDRPFRGRLGYKCLRLLRVTEFDERAELRKLAEVQPAAELSWEEAGVVVLDAVEAAVTLGTGRFGQFYPSLRRLPQTTGDLVANVKWSSVGNVDSFTLTVSVTHKAAKATIPGRPQVYLLIETDAEPEAQAIRDLLARLEPEDRTVDADHPFKLTVNLPNDWGEEVAAPGPARVAVLIASKELDCKWGQRMEKAKPVDAADRAEFVLRTEWREINLPKPVERLKKGDR